MAGPQNATPFDVMEFPPRLRRGRRWWMRLKRDRTFVFAVTGLGLMVAVVVGGPWLSPYGESEQLLENTYAPPGAAHWFGTDVLGRDLLTRMMYGGRISLIVGLAGAAISLSIGVLVGGVAGLAGGWTERLLMRFIDFLYGVPLLLVVIALMVITGPGLTNIFLALGLVYWLQMARMVRARVVELRTRDFIAAARVLGAGWNRILLVHLIPNAMGVIAVTTTFMIPQAIFAESFLSFLGLGVTLPHASWGTLAAEGLTAMAVHPHVLAFPAVAICLTIFLFQTLGEAMRAALDPHRKGLD